MNPVLNFWLFTT